MLQQWPLPDTLTAARPPGGIEISGSTARIRFVDNAATVTTELSDPPLPPGSKPLVRVEGWSDLHGIDQAG